LQATTAASVNEIQALGLTKSRRVDERSGVRVNGLLEAQS
jgi:hypothetical protein